MLEKQRKLLELQQCKLELEVREATKKIEEEKRRRAMDAANATVRLPLPFTFNRGIALH